MSASSSSTRATGMPLLDRLDHVSTAASPSGTRTPPPTWPRDRDQAQRDLGDDAERALGADEQAREVVAGRRLARARRRCG